MDNKNKNKKYKKKELPDLMLNVLNLYREDGPRSKETAPAPGTATLPPVGCSADRSRPTAPPPGSHGMSGIAPACRSGFARRSYSK
jgi:hypothetical protein